MRTYARIHDGRVAEILKTEGDIKAMFHPSLAWVDITAQPNVVEGWHFDGTKFTAPPAAPPADAVVTVAELQAQLARLSAQLATLSSHPN